MLRRGCRGCVAPNWSSGRTSARFSSYGRETVRSYASSAEPEKSSRAGLAVTAVLVTAVPAGVYLYLNPDQRNLFAQRIKGLWHSEEIRQEGINPHDMEENTKTIVIELEEERPIELPLSKGAPASFEPQPQPLKVDDEGLDEANKEEAPEFHETEATLSESNSDVVRQDASIAAPLPSSVEQESEALTVAALEKPDLPELNKDEGNADQVPFQSQPLSLEKRVVETTIPEPDLQQKPSAEPTATKESTVEKEQAPEKEEEAKPANRKRSKQENPYLQPSASPELFRDIFTMQKESYEKMLAEKDAKLKRKLEKQRALLIEQHEQVLMQLRQEQQKEFERQEQLLLEKYQNQIAQLEAERRKIAEEVQAFVESEKRKLGEDFERQVSSERKALLEKLNEQHASRLALVQELESKIQAQNKIFEEHLSFSKSSLSAHTLSLALVELSAALEHHSRPFSFQLHRLKEAAKGEPIIEAAADSIEGLAEEGVYSYDSLKQRFSRLQKHAHRAALVPPNGGMWWHALSVVFASTSLPPSLLHAPGEQTVEILERASRHLDSGQLSDAVLELEKLQGTPKDLARDWIKAAKNRLLLEQALRMVFAELESMTPTVSQS